MKAKIVTVEQPKEFKPITMEFTFETVEEARLMFHALNRSNLRETLQMSGNNIGTYGWEEYSSSIANRFGNGYTILEEAIKQQGFKI